MKKKKMVGKGRMRAEWGYLRLSRLRGGCDNKQRPGEPQRHCDNNNPMAFVTIPERSQIKERKKERNRSSLLKVEEGCRLDQPEMNEAC